VTWTPRSSLRWAMPTAPPSDRCRVTSPLGWVPLSALVPTCRVVVHHGGAGTTMNALVAAVPQLVLPHGADQHVKRRRRHQRGVGLSHLPEDADPATVSRSLQRLLAEPAFSQAADEVRREIAELPPPAGIVPRCKSWPSGSESEGLLRITRP